MVRKLKENVSSMGQRTSNGISWRLGDIIFMTVEFPALGHSYMTAFLQEPTESPQIKPLYNALMTFLNRYEDILYEALMALAFIFMTSFTRNSIAYRIAIISARTLALIFMT